jgi:molybdenum cofactor sulfurtransferase
MGNSQSTKHHTKSHNSFRRQRSAVFSRISIGCASVDSSTSSQDPSQETSSLVHEKSALRDHQPQLVQLPVAYSPADNVTNDATVAYTSFLREFPGKSIAPCPETSHTIQFHLPLAEYRLTWILDTLRRTDYVRLERTGETYVDFMGGALYPESLIRVHTEFLSRSVMGNTHSVSNR